MLPCFNSLELRYWQRYRTFIPGSLLIATIFLNHTVLPVEKLLVKLVEIHVAKFLEILFIYLFVVAYKFINSF